MRDNVTIRREIVDVEVHGTESDGAALQRRLPGVCADVLAPALDAAFARVDPGDVVLVIERLAIDLPGIVLDRLDRQGRRRLADQYRDRVLQLRPRHADRDRLSAGVFELGFRLRHI